MLMTYISVSMSQHKYIPVKSSCVVVNMSHQQIQTVFKPSTVSLMGVQMSEGIIQTPSVTLDDVILSLCVQIQTAAYDIKANFRNQHRTVWPT